VVEVVGLAGELKRVRIKKPQAFQVRPGVTGLLDVRHIGSVRGLVEAGRHVAAGRAADAGQHEETDDGGRNQQVADRRHRPFARGSRCRGGGHMTDMRGEGLNFS
jgi:hypothetical protein